jgi:hypothetical protein
LAILDQFSSDPYCIVHFEGTAHKAKTKVKLANLNPSWNESFTLYVACPYLVSADVCANIGMLKNDSDRFYESTCSNRQTSCCRYLLQCADAALTHASAHCIATRSTVDEQFTGIRVEMWDKDFTSKDDFMYVVHSRI